MIRGTASALLKAELTLPYGFKPLDPLDIPDLADGLRVEIVDEEGRVRPWQWANMVDWHEALGWRIVPDGTSEPCAYCGELTLDCDDDGEALCASCRDSGDFEPVDPDDCEPEEGEEPGDGRA